MNIRHHDPVLVERGLVPPEEHERVAARGPVARVGGDGAARGGVREVDGDVFGEEGQGGGVAGECVSRCGGGEKGGLRTDEQEVEVQVAVNLEKRAEVEWRASMAAGAGAGAGAAVVRVVRRAKGAVVRRVVSFILRVGSEQVGCVCW